MRKLSGGSDVAGAGNFGAAFFQLPGDLPPQHGFVLDDENLQPTQRGILHDSLLASNLEL